jgi:hypothetical protein
VLSQHLAPPVTARSEGETMTDEPSVPWLGSLATGCPIDEASQRWPTADFFSTANYSASADGIESLISHLCQLMMVERDRITLELFDGSAEAEKNARQGGKRIVGHFQVKDGRAIISLDENEASDPKIMTAIAVHELCHMRLLGEDRIRRGRPDSERLTDLLTAYFGFGTFSTNAAMSFARSDRGFMIVSRGLVGDRELNGAARNQGYRRIGYLSSAEFGYALACYCWLRREQAPGWTRYVNPGPLVYLEQGLAYLTGIGAIGQLPTQRVGR